jgi:hypothetical protein
MLSRVKIAGAVVATSLGLAACGGSKPMTDRQQIRSVEINMLQRFATAHPESACPFTDSPSTCVGQMLAAKALTNNDLGSLLPVDWRTQIKEASITVTGNRARVNLKLGTGSSGTQLVKRNGHWLVVVNGN